jgi:hypothetical protein
LRLRRRPGVSTYLETFLLVAVALGASSVAAGAALTYAAAGEGPSMTLAGASASQGPDAATEWVAVYNAGTVALGPLAVDTAGVSGSSQFCYTAFDAASLAVEASTCPSMAAGPSSVSVQVRVLPGRGVSIELVFSGQAFTVGEACEITVSAAQGTQQAAGAEVSAA